MVQGSWPRGFIAKSMYYLLLDILHQYQHHLEAYCFIKAEKFLLLYHNVVLLKKHTHWKKGKAKMEHFIT